MQWHFQIDIRILLATLVTSLITATTFFFISFFERFKFLAIAGISVVILFASLGALLCRQKDIRTHPEWFGNFYNKESALVVT